MKTAYVTAFLQVVSLETGLTSIAIATDKREYHEMNRQATHSFFVRFPLPPALKELVEVDTVVIVHSDLNIVEMDIDAEGLRLSLAEILLMTAIDDVNIFSTETANLSGFVEVV